MFTCNKCGGVRKIDGIKLICLSCGAEAPMPYREVSYDKLLEEYRTLRDLLIDILDDRPNAFEKAREFFRQGIAPTFLR